MAYFPNGTAGAMFQEDNCIGCMNYRDKEDGRGYGCAVWDAHLIAEYGEGERVEAQRILLDVLIPNGKDGLGAGECAMFLSDGRDHKTLPLFPGGSLG